MAYELVAQQNADWHKSSRWARILEGSNLSKWYGRALCYRQAWKQHLDGILEIPTKGKVLILGSAVENMAGEIQDSYEHLSVVNYVRAKPEPKNINKKVVYQLMGADFDLHALGNDFDFVLDNGYLDYVHLVKCPDDGAKVLSALPKLCKDNGSFAVLTLGVNAVALSYVKAFMKTTDDVTMLTFAVPSNPLNSQNPLPIMMVHRKGNNNDGKFTLNNKYLLHRGVTPSEYSILQLFKVIKDVRHIWHISNTVSQLVPGQFQHFEVLDDKKKPVYTISLYDWAIPNDENRKLQDTVAVLVSLSEQHHWLYKTPTGQAKLAARAGARRVLCIYLPDFGGNQLFASTAQAADMVNNLKNEIGPFLVDLSNNRSKPVMLMTQQESYQDDRKIVSCIDSDYAGKMLVFDAVVDQNDDEIRGYTTEDVSAPPKPSKYMRRTMIFESSPRSAQTELWYELRDEGKIVFNYAHVCHSYHLLISLAILSLPQMVTLSNLRGTVLGVGGGVLNSLLKNSFPNLDVTAVDIDAAVVQAAREYFGYSDSDGHLTTKICDGLVYVKEAPSKVNFLVVDINGQHDCFQSGLSGVTSPPNVFLEPEFLSACANHITEDGIVLFNIVCQTEEARKAVGGHLSKHFATVISLRYAPELNEVFLCGGRSYVLNSDAFDSVRATFKNMSSTYGYLNAIINSTPLYLGKKSPYVVSQTTW